MSSRTPENLELQARPLPVELPDPLPRHWHSGDPFRTHFFNALSILFPLGERYFIDSVRQVRDRVDDEKLQHEVTGFIRQEGGHSQVHQEYNQRLRDLGYDVDRLEGKLKKRIDYIQTHFSPEKQLAGTIAFEHFTAMLADTLLREPEWLDGADPAMQTLWRWHSREETEHKSVAFDLYMHISGDRKMLRSVMRQITVLFLLDISRGMRHMLRRDGRFWDLPLWWRGMRFFWGRRGLFVRLIPSYREFYRHDFHPWQHDNRELLEDYPLQPTRSGGDTD